MSEKTIKPCPFCGGRGELEGGPNFEGNTIFWVWCGCHAHGPTKETRQEALEAWNRRAK